MGNSTSQPSKQEFKVHIGIDFGSDGCALAFAYKGEVTVYNKWKAKKRSRAVKTKTQILLNDKDEVVAFGNTAKFMYSNLSGKERRSWKFFERFKMSLYSDSNKKEMMNDDEKYIQIDVGDTLTAINGKTSPAETVFVAAFEHLGQIAREYLDKITKNEQIEDNQIQWIVTVPSIWDYKSKGRMEQWLIKAGLVNKNIKDQCRIVYEPDCAALAIYNEHIKKNILNTMEDKENNDKYILIDAGGGTIDVACHKIVNHEQVEDIHCPSGGPWGGGYIDDQWIVLLTKIFSKQWIEEFRRETPNIYTDLVDNFQAAKENFHDDVEAKTHSVELPYEFLQFIHEKCKENDTEIDAKLQQIPKSIKDFRKLFGNESEQKEDAVDALPIKLNDESLEIDVKIWKCIFDSLIDEIIVHVHKLLNLDALQGKCKYLYLVGGFAASKYFQKRIQHEFGKDSEYKMQITIPDKPTLTIVKGAAYFGMKKDFVVARKLKCTYGIKVDVDVSAARNAGIPEDYINCKDNRNKDGSVKDCFSVIVRRNTRIPLGHGFIVNGMYGVHNANNITLISILSSDMEDPKVATDGKEVGTSTIKLIEHPWLKTGGDYIATEFYFDTLLSVFLCDRGSKNAYNTVFGNLAHRRKKLEIRY